MALKIKSLIRKVILGVLIRLLPLEFRLSRGWDLRVVDKRRLIEDLLAKTDTNSPHAGERVLLWSPGGVPMMLDVEGAIAAALRLRGVDVHAVICDGPFRACVLRELDRDGKYLPVSEWSKTCARCRRNTSASLKSMGIRHSFIGDFVPESLRKELWEMTESVTWESLDNLSYGNIQLGRNVKSAILRYLKGFDLAGHEEVVREYAYTALVIAAAAASACERISPSRIFMSHGIYADWGPAVNIAFSRKLPITVWQGSYLKARFYFRHLEDMRQLSLHCLSQAAWEERKSKPLSLIEDKRLDIYLDNRYRRQISFDLKNLEQYQGATSQFHQKYGLSPDKPVWGINTHINWDAVTDYSPMSHESLDEWVEDTVREIAGITDVQWLIKIHPVEAWENPRSGAQHLIERQYPSLPAHVRLIPPEEEISPLDFYNLIDGCVTVYGTPGLEMAIMGKPVILAGEAHYGGKGFTYDGLNRESYRQLLHQARMLKPLSKEQQDLARRYAYCYFIQRQVPIPIVNTPAPIRFQLQFQKRELLLPGKDPFMDFICERILDGKDFIMDERFVEMLEREQS